MFCEYCGEMIRSGATKCPCCGVRVSVHTNNDYDNHAASPSANSNPDNYYENLSTTENIPTANTATSNTAADILMILLSVFMPVIGIACAFVFFKQKKIAKGVICLCLGLLPILSFVLLFVIAFMGETIEFIVR